MAADPPRGEPGVLSGVGEVNASIPVQFSTSNISSSDDSTVHKAPKSPIDTDFIRVYNSSDSLEVSPAPCCSFKMVDRVIESLKSLQTSSTTLLTIRPQVPTIQDGAIHTSTQSGRSIPFSTSSSSPSSIPAAIAQILPAAQFSTTMPFRTESADKQQ